MFAPGAGGEMGSVPRRPWVAYLVVVLSPLPPVLVLAVIATFGDHQPPAGQCEGIGFGCVPSPATGAQLLLLLFAAPVAAAQIALGCGALALLRLWERYRRAPVVVQGLIPAAPMLVLTVALLVAATSGSAWPGG